MTPTEQSAEKAAVEHPWCKGSMRDPKHSTDVNGKPWGMCRTCREYAPMVPGRPVLKMHRDRSLPPGQNGESL